MVVLMILQFSEIEKKLIFINVEQILKNIKIIIFI